MPASCSRPTPPPKDLPGMTNQSPRPSTSVPLPSCGSANGSSSTGWRPPWSASPSTGRAESGSSTAGPRRDLSPWPARRRRRAATSGRCSSWPTSSSSCRSWTRSPTRPCAGRSKNELKPWLKEQWCLPPEANAEFVAAMEDVLDVYHRPFDPKRPLVCLDEASKQLIGEVAEPVSAEPGRPERIDYEYTRNGTANLFMVSEPLVGWRHVEVTERRTARDFAEVVRWLVEEVHEEAEKVVLVMDNLNTHKLASLYEAFPPERARRIAARLEIHHTPKHGSWMNMAEIERSVLSRQCLSRRIGTQGELRSEVAAWEGARNARGVVIRWQFTTADARIKLRRLYPTTP